MQEFKPNQQSQSKQLAYLPNFVIVAKKNWEKISNKSFNKSTSQTDSETLKQLKWLKFIVNSFIKQIIYFGYCQLRNLIIVGFTLKYNVVELWEISQDRESRHLFWLNNNLKFKIWLANIIPNLHKIWIISLKAHLLFLVIGVLIVTKIVPANQITNSRSFLSQAIENYTIKSTFLEFTQANLTNISTKNKNLEDQLRIKQYEPKKGQTIELIAEEYGVKTDTLVINNNLEKDKPLPKTIYIPWQDSYLHFAKLEVSPKELSEQYKVEENQIYAKNEDIINYENGKFPAGKIVIIPTSNFDIIKKSQDEAKIKLKEEETKKEQDERRKKFAEIYQEQIKQLSDKTKAIGNTNTGPNTGKYSNAFSGDKRSSGFIWPTKGSISRCLEPGHLACDIANSSMPPVYTVQDGFVEDVYRFTVYGYGNAVVVNHGNGLKTLYAHLNEIYVTKGQTVAQGQAVGQMGNTGNSTGTHLHFEVKESGINQNPLAYLP